MKSIKIRTENDGKEYTLAFTRMVVRNMMRAGFKLEDCLNIPLDGIPRLFNGAFRAFHPGTEMEVTDKIWEESPNKEALLKALMQMFHEPVDSLFDEPTEKNATWEVVE